MNNCHVGQRLKHTPSGFVGQVDARHFDRKLSDEEASSAAPDRVTLEAADGKRETVAFAECEAAS